MSEPSAFEQSRIYAQGWNAARRLQSQADAEKAVSLNPYAADPQRARWAEGFLKAMG